MWSLSTGGVSAAEDVLHEGRFGLRVGVPVPAEPLCRVVLEACILGEDLAMGAQVVPEPQFVVEAGRDNGNHVGVLGAASWVWLAEPLHLAGTVGDVQVAERGHKADAGTRSP